ncbi:MAG: hypothetical protein EZS28_021217 [Streblomastix strix]|uniref:Uncharacterized protein n=1 Tax=Streblomastix strix TaxID=222440 RepID=A0A5J4VKT8_9EUKA|nr:MAG: hypothetical protein EZS28_021217 [Streblomastix strix]
MVYTELRMADLQKAELRIQKADQGEIITATMTVKKPRGPVEKKLQAAQDRTVCPRKWIWSWLKKREVKGEQKKEQVWKNKKKEKVRNADKCSNGRCSHQRKDCDIIRSQGELCITSCRQCELTWFPPRTNIRSYAINNYVVEKRLTCTQSQHHLDFLTRRMTISTLIINMIATTQ